MKDKYSLKSRRALTALLPLAMLMAGATAKAAVVILADVQFDAGSSLYTYSYTVTNTGLDFDIASIDIPTGTGVSVTNPTAPNGFFIVVDGDPVNLVSFLEDFDSGTTDTFSPGSTRGNFTYQSATAPLTVTFTALDANGDSYTGTTLSAVPETTAPLLTLAAALPLLARRRRQQA